MLRRVIVPLCIVALCLGSLSCQKLSRSTGPLKVEEIKTLDAIPMEYGNLVAVTTDSSHPNCAQLWFEKSDKTVVVATLNWSQRAVWEGAMVIPRR
jgi:hypothetical protein